MRFDLYVARKGINCTEILFGNSYLLRIPSKPICSLWGLWEFNALVGCNVIYVSFTTKADSHLQTQHFEFVFVHHFNEKLVDQCRGECFRFGIFNA